ncbi:MAG: OmpA family protein [Acinetobacter sp.]|nr:OmpA family protein [Acinetobacter sp.]
MNKKILAVIVSSAFFVGCATTSGNKNTTDEKAEVQNALTELKSGVSIHFANNSSQIDPQYQPYLLAAAKGLAQSPDFKLKIDGHTDGSGTKAVNQKLSLARANSVATVLVAEHSVNSDQLVTEGFGSTQPLASNSTAEGRATNRRATVTLITP